MRNAKAIEKSLMYIDKSHDIGYGLIEVRMKFIKYLTICIVGILIFSCERNYNVADEIRQPIRDSFFTVVDSLRIRAEPTIDSEQIGSLRLFDMADIIGKTENSSVVDGIDDFWYKVSFNGIEGYVFGGYGIILKAKYEIRTIDDFVNIFPQSFHVNKTARFIFTWDHNNDVPMVRLDYIITFMDHRFNFQIYLRTISGIDVNNVSAQYNLQIIEANNNFGIGDQYRLLAESNFSDPFITLHGNHGRYFFLHWGSSFSYDIASFLFEIEFDSIFDGILISPFNLWLDINDSENIMSINNNFIREARINRTRESILYHILFETMLRLRIE